MPEYIYERPYLYPKQLAAIFHSKRYGLIEASTKAGKTVACIIWLGEQALMGKPGQNFWWVAPGYNQAKIAYKRLKQYLDPSLYSSNEQDLTVTLKPSQTTVWFKTGEVPDKLYGEDVYAAVMDEASRIREDAFVAVRSTLTATQGAIRIIGNVKGRKNWFYNLARQAEKVSDDPKSNMHYAKMTAYDAVDAGIFPLQELQDAKDQLPEHVFRELYMAEAADDGGNPFGGDVAIERCIIPHLTHKPVVAWGWDFAKSNDWTVGIGLDADGNTAECYRWKRSWRDTIRDVVKITGSTPAYGDATGVGDPVLEYIQLHAPETFRGFVFTSKSKQQLMEALAIAISSQEIGFVNVPIGLEVRSFEYDYTRTGVKYSAPQGEHDDCVCALALAWKRFRKPAVPAWVQKARDWKAPRVTIFAR